MENYVIRRITTNDYHDIHELNLKLGYAYDEEKVAERIQNILDAGIDLILVAELEGKVVGYVHGTPYGTLIILSVSFKWYSRMKQEKIRK